MKEKIFIQLGKIGDIINALPLAKEYYDEHGKRPRFMVAKEFASVLDRVGYVEPLIFDGHFSNVHRALYQARSMSENLTLCQIYGDGVSFQRRCTSFAVESWMKTGTSMRWGSVAPVFDRRDLEAEKLLYVEHGKGPGGLVLVALEGHSSPFPFRNAVLAAVASYCEDRAHQLIDLSKIHAGNFVDLLGLFDRARVLITVDTGHLHLAAASRVPVIALCTREPTPWHGSPARLNQVARFLYDEFPAAVPRLVAALDSPRQKTMFAHAWTGAPYLLNRGNNRREEIASFSRHKEFAAAPGVWVDRFYDSRISSGYVEPGTGAVLPFVREVIEYGAGATSRDSDIIALTNADICFAPNLTARVLDAVRRHGAVYTHRIDFDRIDEPIVHDGQLAAGKFYPGSDAFFFSVGWWIENRHRLGNYVWAREFWDQGLRQLIKFTGGRELEKAVYHEAHVSTWQNPEHRATLAGNLHNRGELEKWFKETGLKENDHLYWSMNTEFYK